MEDLFELVLDLIIEGTEELSSNRRVTKWIRYPLIFIISAMALGIIILIIWLGISIIKKNLIVGIMCICLGVFMLLGCIRKFIRRYLQRR